MSPSPGTFSMAPMPSFFTSPFCHSALPPSKPGASSTFPVAEDSAPPSWPTQGQRARGSGTPTPHQQSSVGPGKPQALCLLGALDSPGAEAPCWRVIGIMASRAEPRTGNQESRAPSGCPSPAKDREKAGLAERGWPRWSCPHLRPLAPPPTRTELFPSSMCPGGHSTHPPQGL